MVNDVKIRVPRKPRKKKCAKCGLTKQAEKHFAKHSGSSDGRASYCNTCRNALNTKRRKENAGFRLKHHIATRCLKQLKATPGGTPEELTKNLESYLGYRIWQLRIKLDNELRRNEGINLKEAIEQGYHLDHIKPLSSFDVKSASCPEFVACWAIDNLRMIPADENLAKGAKQDFYGPNSQGVT